MTDRALKILWNDQGQHFEDPSRIENTFDTDGPRDCAYRPRHTFAVLLVTLSACVISAEEPGIIECPPFVPVVQNQLQSACGECHPGAGTFDPNSYRNVVGASKTNDHIVQAGDEKSELLDLIAGANDHPVMEQSTQSALRTWIVDCQAAYGNDARAHPFGFASPTSPEFHGGVLRENGYDTSTCRACHDRPEASISCQTCHNNGVESCNTCHGSTGNYAPPRTTSGSTSPFGAGAHQMHLQGAGVLSRSIDCDTCHKVPADWRDAGHLFTRGEDGLRHIDKDGRAEITFSGLATGEDGKFQTAYDANTGTCTVYCHHMRTVPPTWDIHQDTPRCEICHTLPPTDNLHPNGELGDSCYRCHGLVIGDDGKLIGDGLHLDGKVSLGDGSETCAACHGTRPTGAPPPDINGNYDETGATGAHTAHLGTLRFRTALSCNDCHTPYTGATFSAAVRTPGHISGEGGGVIFGTLATADAATPSYTQASRSCSGVYCHGGGEFLQDDQSLSIKREMFWDPTKNGEPLEEGGVECGSCHGIPPTVGAGHSASYTRQTCVVCHGLVVDETGALIFDSEGKTLHINGVVNFNQ